MTMPVRKVQKRACFGGVRSLACAAFQQVMQFCAAQHDARRLHEHGAPRKSAQT
jgi:hypothetical protein